jgi:hypothetical protein
MIQTKSLLVVALALVCPLATLANDNYYRHSECSSSTPDHRSCREWTSLDGCDRDERIRTEYCPCACERRNTRLDEQRPSEIHILTNPELDSQQDNWSRRNNNGVREGWLMARACIDASYRQATRITRANDMDSCMMICKHQLREGCKSIEYQVRSRQCKISGNTPWTVPQSAVSTPCDRDRSSRRDQTMMALRFGDTDYDELSNLGRYNDNNGCGNGGCGQQYDDRYQIDDHEQPTADFTIVGL